MKNHPQNHPLQLLTGAGSSDKIKKSRKIFLEVYLREEMYS